MPISHILCLHTAAKVITQTRILSASRLEISHLHSLLVLNSNRHKDSWCPQRILVSSKHDTSSSSKRLSSWQRFLHNELLHSILWSSEGMVLSPAHQEDVVILCASQMELKISCKALFPKNALTSVCKRKYATICAAHNVHDLKHHKRLGIQLLEEHEQPYTSTTPPNSNVAKTTANSKPAQCDICDVIAMRPAAFALWLAETQVGATM